MNVMWGRTFGNVKERSLTKLQCCHCSQQSCVDLEALQILEKQNDCDTDHSDRTPAPAVRAPVWFGSCGTADGSSAWELAENLQNTRPLPAEHASPETTRSLNLKSNAKTFLHLQSNVHYFCWNTCSDQTAKMNRAVSRLLGLPTHFNWN